MKAGKVRVAVLGVGRIGKIHTENLATRIAAAELADLGDVFPDELKHLAGRFGVSRTAAHYTADRMD